MKQITIQDHNCIWFKTAEVKKVIIWFAGMHELQSVERIWSNIKGVERVALLCCLIEDWNAELSPWKADAVMGNQAFMGKGAETYEWLMNDLIPWLKQDLAEEEQGILYYLAGYSLAGLFSLYAYVKASGSDERFAGVISCSGSLWFPGFEEYMKQNHLDQNAKIYISLGKKEEKTRNPVLSAIGDKTRGIYQWMVDDCQVKQTVLEWNEGNHFNEPDVRLLKGMRWILSN